jgi:hypothetical protein
MEEEEKDDRQCPDELESNQQITLNVESSLNKQYVYMPRGVGTARYDIGNS